MNKKQIIITCVVAFIAFVAGYFIGDSSAINRVNKQISAKVSNEQSTSKDTKQQSNDSNKKEDTKMYKFGEEGTSGNWNIKVLEVNETDTVQGGNSSDNKTTKEKFIVIKLQMKNIAKQPVQYSPKEFMLGNMKDKSQYNINDSAFNAMGAANSKEKIYNNNDGHMGVYDDVNPNTSKQTYIVFEVSKDFNIADCILINKNGSGDTTGFYLK